MPTTRLERTPDPFIRNKGKEIKMKYKKMAMGLSILCGLLNCIGITSMYLGFMEAAQAGYNAGIISALVCGSNLFGLFGSFFIYREKITPLQLLGSFVSLIGIIVLSLAGTNGSNFLMILGGVICMICLGLRVILAKFICRFISMETYIVVNFIADFGLGCLYLVFYFCSLLKM